MTEVTFAVTEVSFSAKITLRWKFSKKLTEVSFPAFFGVRSVFFPKLMNQHLTNFQISHEKTYM